MRFTFALTGIAALALAQTAAAAPVTMAPISFSPELQTDLDEEYGVREGELLERWVRDAVNGALERSGASVADSAPVTIEIAIVDADPNRPTMEQLAALPGLDPIRSVSLGGAELNATLRGANGQVLGEVTHRRYDMTLDDLNGAVTTWGTARRAIRGFAEKVADAYVANAR